MLSGLETLDYSNHFKEAAQNALESLDASKLNVNGMRANLGALQNRLTSTVENLAFFLEENLSAA